MRHRCWFLPFHSRRRRGCELYSVGAVDGVAKRDCRRQIVDSEPRVRGGWGFRVRGCYQQRWAPWGERDLPQDLLFVLVAAVVGTADVAAAE